ncbi:MAG TPA: hypothetical protein VGL93_26120 [Streptosporangiaceae bacterium]|jgi:hypothetical protein
MAIEPVSDALPCGRSRAELWEHAAAGRLDDHERTCPYCQEAAGAYEPVRRAGAELAARPVRPPAGLAAGVMRAIRGQLVPGRPINLPAPAGSRLTVSETAATALLAAAADNAPGVSVRDCRFPDPDDPTSVEVTAVLRAGHTAPESAAEVRALITEAAATMLGLAVDRVDVAITDLDDSADRRS